MDSVAIHDIPHSGKTGHMSGYQIAHLKDTVTVMAKSDQGELLELAVFVQLRRLAQHCGERRRSRVSRRGFNSDTMGATTSTVSGMGHGSLNCQS